jgi:hypothetical protein
MLKIHVMAYRMLTQQRIVTIFIAPKSIVILSPTTMSIGIIVILRNIRMIVVQPSNNIISNTVKKKILLDWTISLVPHLGYFDTLCVYQSHGGPLSTPFSIRIGSFYLGGIGGCISLSTHCEHFTRFVAVDTRE